MTILRRLARLEALQPPPPPPARVVSYDAWPTWVIAILANGGREARAVLSVLDGRRRASEAKGDERDATWCAAQLARVAVAQAEWGR